MEKPIMRTRKNLQSQIDLATKILANHPTQEEFQTWAKQLAELVLDLATMIHDGLPLPKQWPIAK